LENKQLKMLHTFPSRQDRQVTTPYKGRITLLSIKLDNTGTVMINLIMQFIIIIKSRQGHLIQGNIQTK
jgi:hypothetical protein